MDIAWRNTKKELLRDNEFSALIAIHGSRLELLQAN